MTEDERRDATGRHEPLRTTPGIGGPDGGRLKPSRPACAPLVSVTPTLHGIGPHGQEPPGTRGADGPSEAPTSIFTRDTEPAATVDATLPSFADDLPSCFLGTKTRVEGMGQRLVADGERDGRRSAPLAPASEAVLDGDPFDEFVRRTMAAQGDTLLLDPVEDEPASDAFDLPVPVARPMAGTATDPARRAQWSRARQALLAAIDSRLDSPEPLPAWRWTLHSDGDEARE